MNQILKLREERANTWEMAKAFLESHRDKDGMVSAEDSAVYDRMEEKVVALGKEIERLERQRNIDDEMNKTIDTALKVNPGAGNLKPDTKVGRASDAYTKAFWQAFRGKGNIQEIKDTLTIGSATPSAPPPVITPFRLWQVTGKRPGWKKAVPIRKAMTPSAR